MMFWNCEYFDEDVLNIKEKKLKVSWFFIIEWIKSNRYNLIVILKHQEMYNGTIKHCERDRAVNKLLNISNDTKYLHYQKKLKHEQV